MNKIQLDENISAKKLASNCKKEKLSHPVQFPRKFKGQGVDDLTVLEYCIAKDLKLLTNDRTFLEDNYEDLPSQHPGIIIVTISKNNHHKEFITWKRAEKILKRMKNLIEGWNTQIFKNSILIITDQSFEIFHIENQKIKQDGVFNPLRKGWQKSFKNILNQNSKNFPIKP